jgi:putative sugar O-methyltransferase
LENPSPSFLSGYQALKALEAAAEQEERSQSSYWRNEVTSVRIKADGTLEGASVLGMISRKRGWYHRLAHWLLQAPFRMMGWGFKPLADSLALGHLIAERQQRAFTYDLLRHSLTLALIRHFIPLDRADQVSVVIGDGYGMMGSLLRLAAPQRKVIICNLNKPLLLDLVFVRQALPGEVVALVRTEAELTAALADPSIGTIGVQADNCAILTAAPIELAVNIVSMQEMDPPVVAEYFRLLRHNRADRTAFYCCNRLLKRLQDGTEVRFEQYPWQAGDQILLDGICRWSQVTYSPRPPFWTYRRARNRLTWHRLAWLSRP